MEDCQYEYFRLILGISMLFILHHGKARTLRRPWPFVVIEEPGLKFKGKKAGLLKRLKSRSLQQHAIYIYIRYFPYKTVFSVHWYLKNPIHVYTIPRTCLLSELIEKIFSSDALSCFPFFIAVSL